MKITLSLLFFCTAFVLTAQPGTLDNSFGNGGKMIENFSAPYVEVYDVALQADGKTIVLANAEFNHLPHVVLIRYNTNGTPDNTFSSDGISDSPLAQPEEKEYPTAMKLQTDGKVLVCGHTGNYPDRAFVVRYNNNGSFDNTFGGTGIIFLPETNLSNINDLVVLPNGQIVLLTSLTGTAEDMGLIKLNTDGSRNTSFGPDGVVIIDASTGYNPAYKKIAVLPDGKFIVGGDPDIYVANNSNINFLLVRINANGTIDNTYGTNGTFSFVPGPADYHGFTDMVVQQNGNVLACGYGSDFYRNTYTFVTRINTNGTKDNFYGNNGVQYITTLYAGPGLQAQISMQIDSKVLLSGFCANASGNYTMAVARLTTGGLLDNSFDGDGIAALQVNNYNSYGIATVQQSDGGIILAGYAGNGTAVSATIGRLSATGQTDNTIQAGSTAIRYIGSGSGDETGQNVLVQPDQKIIVIKDRSNGYNYHISLARYLPDGTPDSSYGVNGKTNADLPGYFVRLYSGMLANGKTMVVCDLNDHQKGYRIYLLRYNANGSPDSSFGTNGKLPVNTNNTAMDIITDAVVQPDGKTVLIAQQIIDIHYRNSTFLIRLNADGSFDNTFNGNGKLLLSDPGNYAYSEQVVVQPDGKMLLPGYANGLRYLKRLNVNGTTDNSFNGGTSVGMTLQNPAIAIQPDGKIVLADPQNKLVRLTSNGTFDATFDSDGIAEPLYSYNPYSGLTDIKFQPDGKILLGGDANDTTYHAPGYLVVRINSNGTPDTSFGNNGSTMVAGVGSNQDVSKSMALQADGKILMTGSVSHDSLYYLYYDDFILFRLNNSNVTPGITYLFTGNGAWNDAANWSNNLIPPATLPAGSNIIINPPAAGVCYLTTIQHIAAGASLTLKAGKQLVVIGSLILQ